MSEQNTNMEEEITVTLTMEDDKEIECAVLTIYKAGENEYIALLPLDEDGESAEGDVYIYRYKEVDDEPVLENIESDEEYELAADKFDEWMDDQDFEELPDEE